MTEDSRQARLADIQEEQAALRERMAQQAAEWQRAAIDWARAAWDDDVQRAIHGDPDTVKMLAGQGLLKKLKVDLTRLKQDAPEKAAELVADPSLWSHVEGTVFRTEGRTPEGADSSVYQARGPRGAPRILDERLRLLRGEALGLLAGAGLLDEQLREASGRSGPRRRYPYAMDVSDEMSDRMGAYSKSYQAFVALAEEREAIEAELKKEEVDRLWNEA